MEGAIYPLVVPAKAGTHNPWPWFCWKCLPHCLID